MSKTFGPRSFADRLNEKTAQDEEAASRLPTTDRGHGERGDAQAGARAWGELDAIGGRRAEANRQR